MTTSFPATERNVEFSLAYDDSHWGYPIVINPYVKLFYAASGPSTVVLGKRGDTYRRRDRHEPDLRLQEVQRHPADLLGADLDHGRSVRVTGTAMTARRTSAVLRRMRRAR